MSCAKNWCFTINNPSVREIHLFNIDGLPSTISYCVWQVERGENGTVHVQGFVQFSAKKRTGQIAKLEYKYKINEVPSSLKPFEHAHLEPMRGTAEQARDYCKKEDSRIDGPWELGFITIKGQRTDLETAYKAIVDSGNWAAGGPKIALKYASGCIKAASKFPPPMREDLKVICIKGDTGIGKTWWAWHEFPDLFSPYYGNTGIWWDGYDGQETVLLEEYRGQLPLQKLLQVLDPYPLRLEVKGGCVPAKFRFIIITTNTHPNDWYQDKPGQFTRDKEREALARRLGIGTPRFIEASTRAELQAKIALARGMGCIPGAAPPPPAAPAPAPAPAPVAAAALVPDKAIVIPDDDEDSQMPPWQIPVPSPDPTPPPQRRKRTLSPDLLIDSNGDFFVNDEILKQWK